MVDLDWKKRIDTPKMGTPPLPQVFSPRPAPPAATSAYEQYLRIPELSRLWAARDVPAWKAEAVLKPALQGLEITFRLVSIAFSDPRPYCNRREWAARLESLAARQLEIIAGLAEDEDAAAWAPICGLAATEGFLSRAQRSSSEVWKIPGATPVVSRTSEASLLPRLAAWDTSEPTASRIRFQIETQMRAAPFTLGLGEPNLEGKPYLEYDLVCRPQELHSLKPSSVHNHENRALHAVNQILESWVYAGRRLLQRIADRVEAHRWSAASADCWLLERAWKLLAEVEDLHMVMDPDDFLRLKSQLAISADSGFCFRSAALVDLMRGSKDLRRLVPTVLGVEVDPNGGPRVQDAAMRLFRWRDGARDEPKVHLLQGFQAVESAVKRFFFAHRQLVAAVMGSLEAGGNRLGGDMLAQVFLEPPYFPSLDAAKTFVGAFWQHQLAGGAAGGPGLRG